MMSVARKEDMSPRGQLVVFRDNEGDIHVAVYEDDGTGTVGVGSGVEFTSCCSGGGKSPETRGALVRLMEAIKKDNDSNPERKGDLG